MEKEREKCPVVKLFYYEESIFFQKIKSWYLKITIFFQKNRRSLSIKKNPVFL